MKGLSGWMKILSRALDYWRWDVEEKCQEQVVLHDTARVWSSGATLTSDK